MSHITIDKTNGCINGYGASDAEARQMAMDAIDADENELDEILATIEAEDSLISFLRTDKTWDMRQVRWDFNRSGQASIDPAFVTRTAGLINLAPAAASLRRTLELIAGADASLNGAGLVTFFTDDVEVAEMQSIEVYACVQPPGCDLYDRITRGVLITIGDDGHPLYQVVDEDAVPVQSWLAPHGNPDLAVVDAVRALNDQVREATMQGAVPGL